MPSTAQQTENFLSSAVPTTSPGTTGIAKEIFDYLRARNAMPELSAVPYMGDGRVGSFNYGGNLPPQGEIKVLNSLGPNGLDEVLAHEGAHAAMRQMWNQSATDPRLKDGLMKFRGGLASASSLAPQWLKERQNYRSTETEMPGWAAGFAQQSGQRDDPAPLHVDPTIATELAIMLEMAQRGLKQQQK